MSELSIKVTIANRVYPLSVLREEEEEVRKAAAFVNERLKALESSFAVKDKLDLLAMLALEMTMEKGHGKKELVNDKIAERLNDIVSRIDAELAAQ